MLILLPVISPQYPNLMATTPLMADIQTMVCNKCLSLTMTILCLAPALLLSQIILKILSRGPK